MNKWYFSLILVLSSLVISAQSQYNSKKDSDPQAKILLDKLKNNMNLTKPWKLSLKWN